MLQRLSSAKLVLGELSPPPVNSQQTTQNVVASSKIIQSSSGRSSYVPATLLGASPGGESSRQAVILRAG